MKEYKFAKMIQALAFLMLHPGAKMYHEGGTKIWIVRIF